MFSFFAINDNKNSIYSQIALFFTMIADVFLVLCNPPLKEVAMISFSIVQILYFVINLLLSNKCNLKNSITIRIVICSFILLSVVIVLNKNLDFLALISVFYYINLVCNVIMAFKNKNAPLIFKLGLLLFLFCDTVIGLQSLETYINFNLDFLLTLNFDLVWLFYLPSQVLLSLSAFKLKYKNSNLIKQNFD
ncbi:MAG: hypothetical protein IJW82_01195 [Clostridia bacterium]|nr:hypothetical protein [Clostridia bacterium]